MSDIFTVKLTLYNVGLHASIKEKRERRERNKELRCVAQIPLNLGNNLAKLGQPLGYWDHPWLMKGQPVLCSPLQCAAWVSCSVAC